MEAILRVILSTFIIQRHLSIIHLLELRLLDRRMAQGEGIFLNRIQFPLSFESRVFFFFGNHLMYKLRMSQSLCEVGYQLRRRSEMIDGCRIILTGPNRMRWLRQRGRDLHIFG